MWKPPSRPSKSAVFNLQNSQLSMWYHHIKIPKHFSVSTCFICKREIAWHLKITWRVGFYFYSLYGDVIIEFGRYICLEVFYCCTCMFTKRFANDCDVFFINITKNCFKANKYEIWCNLLVTMLAAQTKIKTIKTLKQKYFSMQLVQTYAST